MGMYEALMAWCAKNAPWIGYIIMAVFGGVVAHVREWEARNPGMPWRDHVRGITRRTIMGVLAGLLWYLIMKQNNWEGQPYAYIGASLVGMFSPEFFDLLWTLFKQRAGSANNTEKKP